VLFQLQCFSQKARVLKARALGSLRKKARAFWAGCLFRKSSGYFGFPQLSGRNNIVKNEVLAVLAYWLFKNITTKTLANTLPNA